MAMEQLLHRARRVMLHVFGDGPDKKILQQYAIKHGLLDHVKFYGDVANINERMCSMDVILIPSLFESFGYAAVEAMALRLPVIATNVGGLQEIVNSNTGIVVNPASSYEIVRAVEYYLDKPELVKVLAHNGYEKCKNSFDVNRMLATLTRIYIDLAAK
jgi:glycosyltransferase involved in cell wall biosynthesis